MKNKYVIFDLDDTLAYEIHYLKSAYFEIAQKIDPENSNAVFDKMFKMYRNNENVFEQISKRYTKFSISTLLSIYRNHKPKIELNKYAKDLLDFCLNSKYKIGLITDGRSVTQRNKLRALGIEEVFDKIIISEEYNSSKPNIENYLIFLEKGIEEYFYIADNPTKDFVSPNKLGWTTICLLDKGENIHKQNFNLSVEYLPNYKIKELIEVKNYIK